MAAQDNDKIQWWVMRDVTHSLSKDFIYQKLQKEGIDAFTPIRIEERVHSKAKLLIVTPVLHPYLFVHASWNQLAELQRKFPTLQHIYQRSQSREECGLLIDDDDVNDFRLATEMVDTPEYIDPVKLPKSKIGAQVEMKSGPLEGRRFNLYVHEGRGSKIIVKLNKFIATIVPVKSCDYKKC